MNDETIIDALKLFNEKAVKLGGSDFLKKAVSGQMIRLKQSLKFPIEVVGDGPNQESIDAFVLTFRFFIQDKHPQSPTFRRFTNPQKSRKNTGPLPDGPARLKQLP
jgi:hypothetical protein